MNHNINVWAAVSKLFEQVQDLDHEQTEAIILEAGLEPASADLLRKMLAAQQEENLLDHSVDELAGSLLEGFSSRLDTIPEALIGVEFGAWRVTREIARGGMGAVLQAERADGQFDKTVALKVIKPGQYSSLTRDRFLQEMRVLARLEHPNIVRLIDGGINDNGIPWFAMEYVEGQPITEHADQNQLSLEQRVALLIQVCKAIEHAHRNLVVHGDLKPSNILVTARGQIRLLDFGIARSLRDEDSQPALPRFTPRYASPELASGEPLTTASDVFGLCAVLYELISGFSPRDELSTATQADFGQYMHTPAPPVFDMYASSTNTREIADHRSTSARRLKRSLRGDLRWILQLGLTVDPGQRFSTVASLREDLDSFLDGRVVDAHPTSSIYRVGKFVSRYKVPVVAGVLVFIAMAAGTTIATQQAELAKKEAENARWTSDFLIGIFDKADPWRNQQSPISVDELASGAVTDLLENRHSLAPEVRQAAAAILARVEVRLGHLASSEDLLRLQIELLEQQADSDAALAKALINLGTVKNNQGEHAAAIKSHRRAHALQPIGFAPGLTPLLAANGLAYTLVLTQEAKEARELLEQAFEHEDSIKAMENAESLLARLYNTESFLLQLEGDLTGARDASKQATAYAELADDDAPVIIGRTLLGLAETFHQQGDSVVALELDQQVVDIFTKYYGDDHPQTLESQGRLAVSLSNLGQMEEAISVYDAVLEGQIASLGNENQFVAATMGNIAAAYLALGLSQQALDQYSDAQAVWEVIQPELPFNIAINRIGIARSLHSLQHLEESNAEFLTSLEILIGITGTSHPVYSRAEVYYAPLLLDLNLLQEAEKILPAAYQNIHDAYGLESKHTAVAGLRWAQLLARQGEFRQALGLVKGSIEVLDTDANRGRHAMELKQAHELLDSLN